MASIADVARIAGVSPSTVSYALSGKRRISAGTRRRVEDAVAALGYQPHAGARALAGERAMTVGLIAPRCEDLTASIIHQFINAILDTVRAHHHDVVLLDPDEGVAGIRRVAESRLVDGVILMDIDADDDRIALLETLVLPAVVIGTPAAPTGLTCVDLDFAAAARTAVLHLAGQGRRRLALLSPPELPTKSYAVRTHTGFVATAVELGLPHTVHACEPTWAGVEAWLDRATPVPDAIVVQHEAALPLLLTTLRRRGLTMPGDLAVVAICPHGIADQLETSIGYIDVPAPAMATAAADALLHVLDGRGQPRSRMFSPHLLIP